MDQFRYRKNQREVLGAGNYSVDHDGSRHVVYTGLYQGDKIVALLVGKDGDANAEHIAAIGDLITRACNAHDKLVDAAQAALAIFKRQNWLATSNDPEALALRQLCDALVAAGAAGAV